MRGAFYLRGIMWLVFISLAVLYLLHRLTDGESLFEFLLAGEPVASDVLAGILLALICCFIDRPLGDRVNGITRMSYKEVSP